jgi:1-acyl-sn-glycerol-3-phosphate acyltransferase
VTAELAERHGPLDAVVSAGMWGVGLAWLAPMMLSMMAAGALLGHDRIDRLNRLYCRGQVALTGASWRAVVHPDVDPDQPYMFAQNHVNLLDHVSMYPATPHFKQGMELESHFSIPVYGWFMRARGTIPVRRGRGDAERAFLRDGMRATVEKGHSILAFPEGTRTLDGRVGRFRRGLFYLARDLELPVVPTAVTGMHEVLRKGSRVMRPGRVVTVYCDAPIATRGLSDAEIDALADRVHGVVAARVDAHREGRHG